MQKHQSVAALFRFSFTSVSWIGSGRSARGSRVIWVDVARTDILIVVCARLWRPETHVQNIY